MGKPHKHAELIKAWADGAEIQVFNDNLKWVDLNEPLWEPSLEYRIKPKTVKYRLCLVDSYHPRVHVIPYKENELTIENASLFIRWLGDWQEVEL